MNGRTRLIIGVTLVATGLGVAALAFTSGDAAVRYVEDLIADPGAHQTGSFVLMGVPQPRDVPVGDGMATNSAYANSTVSVTAWSRDGVHYHSTHTLTAEPEAGGVRWTHLNETRRAGSPDVAFPSESTSWTLGSLAFPVDAFDDGDGHTPRVWAVYDGVLKNPLQPKPSQFKGHLLTQLPDGSPVPDGALLYAVEPGGITMGCSSKFLPEEEKARHEG